MFALIAVFPLLYNGVAGGNDLRQHYQFAETIRASIQTSEFYPSISGTANNGLGDVGLRFYPPAVYYILAIFQILFGSWYYASLFTFFLLFFTGGVGIYFWTREELGSNQAIIASAIYTFAPYHLNQIYNNFLLADFAATAVFPFCFLFLTRICRKNSAIDYLALAVSYAILILTHLPSLITVSITLGIYGLLLLNKNISISVILKLFASVSTSLILTSFYWLRMVSELDYINHSSPTYFSGDWNYQTNYLLKPSNFSNFQNDLLNLWFADLMLLAIVLITVPTFILLLKVKIKTSNFILSVALLFLFTVFMTTSLSGFLWDNLSLMQKIQFPWRWMSLVNTFGTILISIGIIKSSEVLKHSKNILLPLGLGFVMLLFVFTSFFVIKGTAYIPSEVFEESIANISKSRSFECWWTKWTKISAFDQNEKISIKTRNTEILKWTSTEKIFTIDSGESQTINVAAFFYPHWKAFVNGKSIEVNPSENGLISIPIPEEQINVEILFIEPEFIRIAFVISFTSWVIILFLLGVLVFKSRKYSVENKII